MPAETAVTTGHPNESYDDEPRGRESKSRLESRLESALAARVVLLLLDQPAGKAD